MSGMKNLTVSKAARAGEQLLRSPAPQPDESLMGYILRLAESNYYETPKWILDLAGLKMDNLRNGWRKLCDDSMLLDMCPRCRERITWNRKSVSQCRCGCNWRETICPELPPAQRRAMRLLMRSCGASENEQVTTQSSITPFEQLSFGDLVRVMLCLARFVSIIEPWMDPSRTENHLFHQALEEVAAILDDWPDKFYSLCERHLDKFSSSDLAAHLDRLADRPSLMFLRIAMEEQWVKAARRSFLSYDLSSSRRFIPIEEAGKRMGLSREWVKFHVSTGFLRASAGVSDPQTTLIDAKSVDYFLRARIQIFTTRTTAAELGITAKELFDLIAYGHLKIAGGPQIDGCPETVIDAETLFDLCRRVKRISTLASETAMGLLLQGGSGELMSFDQVREQLQEKNLNFGQWLQAVLDGELVPFKLRPMLGYSFENVRLERFAFRHDQIQQYIARLCPKPKLPIPAEPPNNSVEEIRPKKKGGSMLSKMTVSLMRIWEDHQLQLRLEEIGSCYDAADLKQMAVEIFKRRCANRY